MRTSWYFPALGPDWLHTFVLRYDWFIWLNALHWLVNVIILVLHHCFKGLSNLAIKFQPRELCDVQRIKFPTKKKVSYFLGYPPRQQLLKFFWFSIRTKKEKHMQNKPVNFDCLDFDVAFPWQKLSVFCLVRTDENEKSSRLFQVILMFDVLYETTTWNDNFEVLWRTSAHEAKRLMSSLNYYPSMTVKCMLTQLVLMLHSEGLGTIFFILLLY